MIRFMLLVLILGSTLFAKTIHVAYDASSMNSFSKKDMMIATEIWVKELIKDTGYDLEFTYYDDMSKMAEDLDAGKVDLMTGFGLSFIKYFDLSKLDNAFGVGTKDGLKEVFIVVASKEKGISSIADLKGKSVGVNIDDEVAKLYIQTKVYELTNTQDIKIVEFKSRQRALLKLFFSKVDAVVTTNKSFELLKELNPQVSKKLQIIDTTNIQATSFGFFRKGFDEVAKQEISDMAMKLGNDLYGKQLLMIYKTEAIVDTKVEYLDPIKDIYERSLKIKGLK